MEYNLNSLQKRGIRLDKLVFPWWLEWQHTVVTFDSGWVSFGRSESTLTYLPPPLEWRSRGLIEVYGSFFYSRIHFLKSCACWGGYDAKCCFQPVLDRLQVNLVVFLFEDDLVSPLQTKFFSERCRDSYLPFDGDGWLLHYIFLSCITSVSMVVHETNMLIRG